MDVNHFTDQRIAEIRGGARLTAEERTFLLEDTPRFEECVYKVDELENMGMPH